MLFSAVKDRKETWEINVIFGSRQECPALFCFVLALILSIFTIEILWLTILLSTVLYAWLQQLIHHQDLSCFPLPTSKGPSHYHQVNSVLWTNSDALILAGGKSILVNTNIKRWKVDSFSGPQKYELNGPLLPEKKKKNTTSTTKIICLISAIHQ